MKGDTNFQFVVVVKSVGKPEHKSSEPDESVLHTLCWIQKMYICRDGIGLLMLLPGSWRSYCPPLN